MKRLYLVFIISLIASCSHIKNNINSEFSTLIETKNSSHQINIPQLNNEYYLGFSIDNVMHSSSLGDIHYNIYVPSDYISESSYALFLTLPGYQRLYRFGPGKNL